MAPRIPSDSTVGSSSHASSRMDIDDPVSRRTSVTNISIHDAQQEELEDRFDFLTNALNTIRFDAQRDLNLQPKSTQLALSTKTRPIFKAYGKHGSEAQLSKDIKEFLGSHNNTRGLTVWSPEEAATKEKAANGRMTHLKLLTAARALDAAQREAIARDEDPALIDPTTVENADINNSPLDGRRTLVNDEESLELVQEMEFEPANIRISFPEEVAGNIPPEILTTTNNILNLLNAQANARLEGYVAKYITLHPSPLQTRNGYGILRLGLHEEYAQQASNLFATAQTNNDGLMFEQGQRSWLRECFDHLGVKREGGRQGEMTERERGLIARAVGLDEDAVEGWWEKMAVETRGRKGMAVWMRARELELVRKAKLEGRY
ncbi:uncharacterized protein AB675_3016 [Cyphellophora attinorum]|uniref:Uncharacterized protein n=1 Tax=Cyphellophora attinorum TaxID=1664694 RepID=A0A0N0NK78_9EURO|nr:uncharacterized protein AB675_3016 [Phialophora attinorum]KPI37831.1 hypothetical protein AB675_3016 [Phialophora attinorum]